MTDECKHGSLLRSCEICDRDAEIERLRAEVAEKDKRIEELEGALIEARKTTDLLLEHRHGWEKKQ